jgi:hypothetical protein
MVFICKDCGVFFNHASSMSRHRKHSCKGTVLAKRTNISTNIVEGSTNIVEGSTNIVEKTQTIIKTSQPNQWQCTVCKKCMTRQNKIHHTEQACFRQKYGMYVCMHCGKEYEKMNTRQKHELVCGKRSLDGTLQSSGSGGGGTNITININNIHNNNNLTQVQNNNNNLTQIQNNHNNTQIVLNTFGDEDIMGLVDAKKLKEEVEHAVIHDGVDGIGKLIEYLFFNNEFPQNQTIRKRNKNDDFVDVHMGNNVWKSQTMETVMRTIREKTEPILGCVLEPFFADMRRYKAHQRAINRLFTDVLVPLGYEDVIEAWVDKLDQFTPLAAHKIEQTGQIAMRQMRTILYEASKTTNTIL